jgi:hypothetical protein
MPLWHVENPLFVGQLCMGGKMVGVRKRIADGLSSRGVLSRTNRGDEFFCPETFSDKNYFRDMVRFSLLAQREKSFRIPRKRSLSAVATSLDQFMIGPTLEWEWSLLNRFT